MARRDSSNATLTLTTTLLRRDHALCCKGAFYLHKQGGSSNGGLTASVLCALFISMDENEYSSRDELDREADLVEDLSSDEESRRRRVATAARLKKQQQQQRQQEGGSSEEDVEEIGDSRRMDPRARSKQASRAPSKAPMNHPARGASRHPSMGRHQSVARQRAEIDSDLDDDDSIDLEAYSDLELEDADDIDALEMEEDEEVPDEEAEEDVTYQLRGAILGICSALGGYEEVQQEDGSWKEVYVPGDDCIGEPFQSPP
jgi:hypothetical protein